MHLQHLHVVLNSGWLGGADAGWTANSEYKDQGDFHTWSLKMNSIHKTKQIVFFSRLWVALIGMVAWKTNDIPTPVKWLSLRAVRVLLTWHVTAQTETSIFATLHENAVNHFTLELKYQEIGKIKGNAMSRTGQHAQCLYAVIHTHVVLMLADQYCCWTVGSCSPDKQPRAKTATNYWIQIAIWLM